MATHTWVDGEAITASKLNNLELKKAMVSCLIDNNLLTDLGDITGQQLKDLLDGMPHLGKCFVDNNGIYQFVCDWNNTYCADSLNDLIRLPK